MCAHHSVHWATCAHHLSAISLSALSQATVVHVCIRSYWVQRLLWEIDGNVAFGPPTVEQLRNAHNLMRDFADEEPLYSQAGNLVALLNAWVPLTGSDLPEMMIALAQKMADEKMWEQVSAVLCGGCLL